MLALSSIESVAFDLDGTLIDSASIKTQAFGKLFRQFGPEVEKAVIDDHLILEGVSRFIKFERWYENLLELEYTESIGIELSRQFNSIIAEDISSAPWMPGALEFLLEWHEKIPLFLVSATPHAELGRLLESRSVTGFFRSFWGFPMQKHQALELIARQLHAQPASVLMVGDAEADYKASLLASTSFCRFSHGKSTWPIDTNLYSCLSSMHQLASLYCFPCSPRT